MNGFFDYVRDEGLLHGRMPAADKAAVMADFSAGRMQVLVATTVIEVGVDVPNATMMLILDAENFGVSQLHQLRGRVGFQPGADAVVLGRRQFAVGRLKRVLGEGGEDIGEE